MKLLLASIVPFLTILILSSCAHEVKEVLEPIPRRVLSFMAKRSMEKIACVIDVTHKTDASALEASDICERAFKAKEYRGK